jgi:branched-chain amino acid transport system permease protein
MAERIKDIDPETEVTILARFYKEDDELDLTAFDWVVDAIDDVNAKTALIKTATEKGVDIISAMGASIFLENFVIATIDGTPRNYPTIFNNSIRIGSIALGVDSLLMIVVSVVALLVLVFIIQKTKVGLAIRACSYNEKAATLMGVNGSLVIFIVFLMGGILAGFAGMLYGMRFIVKPTIGQVTNKSFVAAVFGGLGSLPGAILGSVLLGIMEIFVASFNSSLRDLFVYGLLIIVLIVRPSGLMGKVTEDKA